MTITILNEFLIFNNEKLKINYPNPTLFSKSHDIIVTSYKQAGFSLFIVARIVLEHPLINLSGWSPLIKTSIVLIKRF